MLQVLAPGSSLLSAVGAPSPTAGPASHAVSLTFSPHNLRVEPWREEEEEQQREPSKGDDEEPSADAAWYAAGRRNIRSPEKPTKEKAQPASLTMRAAARSPHRRKSRM